MKRFAACIEYDGSCYKGWQKQPHAISVQEAVECAISLVANRKTEIICAGRTDTGVHAVGQIIHFDSDAQRVSYQWQRGINSHLPSSVSLRWIQEVDAEFHARFSATRRYYRYIIYNSNIRPAIFRYHTCWQFKKLSLTRMQIASNYLVGKQDFSSFRASSCQAKTAIRDIKNLQVSQAGDYFYIDISADAFLHHMVRNIAGTLMEVGSSEKEPEWVEALLAEKNRCLAGMTASPAGLYLQGVDYPERYHLPPMPLLVSLN